MNEPERRREWTFQISEAFPADSPLARFVVTAAHAMNDSDFANSRFVSAKEDYERIYFFMLASSHLYEAAEAFHQGHREWDEVRKFVESLDEEHQQDFAKVTGLAAPGAAWPAQRLKDLRNSFFHYLRLDRAAADAGRLPLVDGLKAAADSEGRLVIEPDGILTGIRAVFADEVFVSTISADYEDGELKRLVAALADYQPALNRFAQAAVGRYLNQLPEGVLHEAEEEDE